MRTVQVKEERMSVVEAKIKELGITLPEAPAPIATYVPGVRVGNLMFLSGVGPIAGEGGRVYAGKVGKDLTQEEGYVAARLTGINLLARIKGELGDLDKLKRIVKLLSMVNCVPGFNQMPAVANGCSDLMVEVFGEKGRHARSAVGMNSLPNDIPVEIEMIIEVED
jgi:enamine deaminase RidA (YjgF/YER057c/UK114 family)